VASRRQRQVKRHRLCAGSTSASRARASWSFSSCAGSSSGSRSPAPQGRFSHLALRAIEAPAAPLVETGDDSTLSVRNRRPHWPGLEGLPREKFAGLEIPKPLHSALVERGISEPSGIQSLVIPRLAVGEHVILQSPTGGGKTLSFLLPLLARLQPTLHVGVQAIILVPSPELALQIANVLRWLVASTAGPNGRCWFNPQVPLDQMFEVVLSRSGLWDAVARDITVLISTPGILLKEFTGLKNKALKQAETLAYFLASNLDTIIIDEVDSLCKVTGKRERPAATEMVLESIFDVIRRKYRNRPIQLVCASATSNLHPVHKTVKGVLKKKYPKRRDAGKCIPVLVTHGMREQDPNSDDLIRTVTVPDTITHSYVMLEEDDDFFAVSRMRMTARVAAKLEGVTVVFVPKKMKASAVVEVLREAGVEADMFHSLVGLGRPQEKKEEEEEEDVDKLWLKQQSNDAIQKFPRKDMDEVLQPMEELNEELSDGGRRVLVVSENHARGLDLEGVGHVIIMRIPHSIKNYVHMAGRTGRMGRTGTAISLISPTEHKKNPSTLEDVLNIRFWPWDVATGKILKEDALPVLSPAPESTTPVASTDASPVAKVDTASLPQEEGAAVQAEEDRAEA